MQGARVHSHSAACGPAARPKRSVRASSAAGAPQPAQKQPMGWRGDPLPQKSLPLLPDGKPDYSSIDASPISKVLMTTIRRLLVKEVGHDSDPRPYDNFDALMTPVREVNDGPGTARDVVVRAKRVFAGMLPGLGIGWVIPFWRVAVKPYAPDWFQRWAFFLVFRTLFPWLMGPMEGTQHVEVEVLGVKLRLPQAVKAERCRFIETAGCASVCVNSCKAPSQEWLMEDFGMPMHIRPNYDDFSCEWRFGVEPPPLEEDEAVLVPCFSQCTSAVKGEKDAARQVARAARGVGIEGGVDKYPGESLEAIAARASQAAIEDATRDGTALSAESLRERVDEVGRQSKCWSVGEARVATLEDVGRPSKL
ncbi:unnamed protein product [Pedinophyceae sp. YPF-701]|nr:unnamed protein product [Pedinophyceae sp. YPF-701]